MIPEEMPFRKQHVWYPNYKFSRNHRKGFSMAFPYPLQGMNTRRWNHKFWLVLWRFALPLTKQGTTATVPLHQRREHDQPNSFQTSPSLPPQKNNKTSYSTPSNHGFDQIFCIGTPILCLEFGTNAHGRRLNIRWCITNQVQRPHRFPWILVTTNGKTWWDGFLVLCFFTPVHSREHPTTSP